MLHIHGTSDAIVPYELPRIPGDVDKSRSLDVTDADLLVSQIVLGPFKSEFDINDDSVVDDADLDNWLSDAGKAHGFASAFLAGDSNLDGTVNSNDLNNLALRWRQDTASWSSGDFAADGSVDSGDLNALALNWRQSIPLASHNTVVPELSTVTLALLSLVLCSGLRRRCE